MRREGSGGELREGGFVRYGRQGLPARIDGSISSIDRQARTVGFVSLQRGPLQGRGSTSSCTAAPASECGRARVVLRHLSAGRLRPLQRPPDSQHEDPTQHHHRQNRRGHRLPPLVRIYHRASGQSRLRGYARERLPGPHRRANGQISRENILRQRWYSVFWFVAASAWWGISGWGITGWGITRWGITGLS